MASGKTHLSIELLLLTGVTGASVYYSIPWWNHQLALACVCGYIVSMFFMSPDMDLYHNKSSRRWKGFKWIWWPYAQIFKHRGISHSIFLGSLTRIGYIFVVGFLCYQAYFLFQGSTAKLESKYLIALFTEPILYSFILGIWLNDLVHILVDKVS